MLVVYRDTDLQQYKLEPQLFLLPEMVKAVGYDTSRLVVSPLDVYQSLANAGHGNSY